MRHKHPNQTSISALKDLWPSGKPENSVTLLKALHILTRDGALNADSRRKLKQVLHLVQLLRPSLDALLAEKEAPVLADLGAGKSYLGFILYDLVFGPAGRGRVVGVEARDTETGATFAVHARAVINATGIFTDALRQQEDPAAPRIMAYSQGSHVVLPREFFPGDAAMLVPKTSDGRVLFLVPWLGRVILGTTDTPVPAAEMEPAAAGNTESVGGLLYTTYLLPFEIASVLLLVAIVGAVVLAKREL